MQTISSKAGLRPFSLNWSQKDDPIDMDADKMLPAIQPFGKVRVFITPQAAVDAEPNGGGTVVLHGEMIADDIEIPLGDHQFSFWEKQTGMPCHMPVTLTHGGLAND